MRSRIIVTKPMAYGYRDCAFPKIKPRFPVSRDKAFIDA